MLTPTSDFKKGNEIKEVSSRFFELLKPQKGLLINIFLASILITVFGLLGSFYLVLVQPLISITSIIIVFLDKKFYIINKVNFILDKKFKVTKRPQFYIILLNLGKNQDLSISKIILKKSGRSLKNGIF